MSYDTTPNTKTHTNMNECKITTTKCQLNPQIP